MSDATFRSLPDLASRALAGSVVMANDELFAQRENLIKPEPAVFSSQDFGHKGKVYDGWETRRRREPGSDHAIVRLGVPGVVHGVIIDTAWFKGNFPPFASVEAASIEGYPAPEELERAHWQSLVVKSEILGDTENAFAVTNPQRFTHVRLTIFPDGGVARLRVHGQPVPDPRFLTGTIDLAALENGGAIVDCSNWFYSSPANIIAPGRARTMGEGWENARRRDDGNDFVTVRLAARGVADRVEIDTSFFLGNAAGWASLRGLDAGGRATAAEFHSQDVQHDSLSAEHDSFAADDHWVDLIPRTRLQPDTRHLFRVASKSAVSHVRLDVFPDGGLARLRVNGRLTQEAMTGAVARWLDLLPEAHATEVLVAEGRLGNNAAAALTALRPYSGTDTLPADVALRFLA